MQSTHIKTIGNWIGHNIFVIVATVIFVSYSFILYLPPHYSWFERQRYLMAIGQIIVGFVEFPLRLITLFTSATGIKLIGIVAFIYFILAGFCVGKVTQLLWKKGWGGRIGLIIAFLANSAMGLFMLAWSDIIVKAEPSQTCENFVSSLNGLRIVEFNEVGIQPGANFFYLFTNDGGITWQQLMNVRYDDPANPDCSTIASLDDGFIWIWSSYGVRTTNDDGNTWIKWDWECCTYGAVEKVEFQNSTRGRMKVFRWQSEISDLFTSDGGKSWRPEN